MVCRKPLAPGAHRFCRRNHQISPYAPMTGVLLVLAVRMCGDAAVASSPSVPGIRMSISTMSGLSSCASPTCPRRCQLRQQRAIVLRPDHQCEDRLRTRVSSSTMGTLIIVGR